MSSLTKYDVIVSDAAKQMLGTHIAFLARVSPQAAGNLKDRLIASMRSLETMPQRYPFFNEAYIPANKYHKMFVETHYLILYQIKDARVYVDYILDCRRDYQWLLH